MLICTEHMYRKIKIFVIYDYDISDSCNYYEKNCHMFSSSNN